MTIFHTFRLDSLCNFNSFLRFCVTLKVFTSSCTVILFGTLSVITHLLKPAEKNAIEHEGMCTNTHTHNHARVLANPNQYTSKPNRVACAPRKRTQAQSSHIDKDMYAKNRCAIHPFIRGLRIDRAPRKATYNVSTCQLQWGKKAQKTKMAVRMYGRVVYTVHMHTLTPIRVRGCAMCVRERRCVRLRMKTFCMAMGCC